MKRSLLLAVILLLAGLFFLADLHQVFTLNALKSGLDRLASWRDTRPLLVYGSFFSLYVAVTALSLPAAAVMTLAAGALFGLAWGTLVVSFASTLGALLAFLVARYLFRNAFRQRFGHRLTVINDGVARDGAFYLFAMRLVPLFPFFLINILMGLTPIRAATFYWVSQVGMLAGTLVYVNAGTQLVRLDSLSGILSPELLLSFTLLGLFPLLARKALGLVQRRRVYGRWQRPARFDRNLVVIGAGAGGLVTAYIAAAVKARVTLVEVHKMGGDCLNFGCVPSKALIRTAKLAHQMRHASRCGLTDTPPEIPFRRVMARLQAIIRNVEPHDSVERYTGLGVEVLQGHARLVDPWTIDVRLNDGGNRRLTAHSIVIAAGARAAVPSLPGLEAVGYLTSDTLWDALARRDEVPRRLVVLGGGPVGCELAQCFARLGSNVIQIQRGPRLLPREDDDVCAFVASILSSEGVQVLTDHRPLRCEREDGRKFIVVAHGSGERRIEFDDLLCAVGREARLDGYGLEALGIRTGRTIQTNEYLETLYPNIFAVGDVAGPYQFTHAAAHQAWYATVNALFGNLKRFRVDYRVMPRTTFVDPEVACVGMNEREATEKGMAFEITRYDLDGLDRAITDSETCGFVKVLTAPGRDRILGVTIVATHAGDMLPEFVLAMKRGIGLAKVLGTLHAYPTWAEANRYVAGEWKRRHAPPLVMQWLARYHNWRRRRSERGSGRTDTVPRHVQPQRRDRL